MKWNAINKFFTFLRKVQFHYLKEFSREEKGKNEKKRKGWFGPLSKYTGKDDM